MNRKMLFALTLSSFWSLTISYILVIIQPLGGCDILPPLISGGMC